MLRHLKISRLAIIDSLEIEFQEGLNVLTGETGAGKSIIIGALSLLLGGKSSGDLVRTGEDEAAIEGLFDSVDASVLPESVADVVGDTDELIICRRIHNSGRSRCYINGSLVTAGVLQSIGRNLISIFGQHEHQVLLNPEEHIEILDKFGLLDKKRGQTENAYYGWRKALDIVDEADQKLKNLSRENEENTAAIKELSAAGIKENEEDALLESREIAKRAGQIREKAYESYQALYSKSGSIIGELSEIKRSLDFLAGVNPNLNPLKQNFEEALYRIQDVALELRGVYESAHSDPKRLEQIEDRLALIKRLKRKYKREVPDLIDFLDKLKRSEDHLFEAKTELKRAAQTAQQEHDAYRNAALNLSTARKKVARKLEAAVKKELKDLAMPHAELSVQMHERGPDKPSPLGFEKVEFFLASNPGESPRPLARTASGGELSRIMLALKALEADNQNSGTVIFDEVDAGIGGHTGTAVGSRLARVAKRQQVLCVTHLHQIAALSDRHLLVRKQVVSGRTHLLVKPLSRDERITELARMLGATPESPVVEHVKNLIDSGVVEVPT